MKFFNTRGRKLEKFRPIKENEVRLYTCGPTVYDYAQLGNLRSFVFDDTLRRTLMAAGYKVKHVMNITDVGHLASDMDEGEDKLEKGAMREGKTVWEVADFYIDIFKKDMHALNILEPNAYHSPSGPYARATDFIDEQINVIKILLERNYAYKTEQAIYFDTLKLPDYGELSGQKLEEKEVGARHDVVTDPSKHHPQDFALWFFRVGRFANHSMHWESPWGDGFPGWHLECSAIIHSTLGDPIDIHTGGVDHIGTHHPNEIAQTEAAFGNKLANYWLHNEFLLVDGQKMSKSLNNFYTLKDVTGRGYDPLALRLLFLQAHYRSQINFTWESLDAAQSRLKRFHNIASLRHQPNTADNSQAHSIDKNIEDIQNIIANDLDTPGALATIETQIDEFEHNGVTENSKENFMRWLTLVDDLLGLRLEENTPDISGAQKQLIIEREKARQAKDWTKADELRAKLNKQGIEINDTPNGPIWSRS